MIVARILVGVLAALVALGTLGSAVRTVVVPRGEQSLLTRATIVTMWRVFDAAARQRLALRVNYDRPLLSLATFIEAPVTSWSSDRSVTIRNPRIVRRGENP